MADISGVRITVLGLELEEFMEPKNAVCDFYINQKLVDSYFMTDNKLKHTFEFSNDFEYIRIAIRAVNSSVPKGQLILTPSFLNEWDLRSGNEQWLPLSLSPDDFLEAEDFGVHKHESPWIRLRFELITPGGLTPQREHLNKSVERNALRSPYNYNNEHQTHPQFTEDSKHPNSTYKTASLRRRDNLSNMPMQVDSTKARSQNK